ncbi:hypothetical protein HA42_17960 [Pantoea deleyi]|uniref:DUF1795 domain-containing protein n=1 Tax=Pantoea deleyi TaxID=470932 RepID=A0A506PYI2_9GAMM|nr:DcrB-related protein [Pantoea deleyi]ORM77300.1 hypothetical protein HA42_17960 [Pantoea deleyi]TPV38587.1 DUF1795 domain-containing protein [Pantoea deleyi]
MHYQFNEGAFALFPAAWQDTTMNIVRDEASGLAWVISRGVIPEESNAEKEFQRQWDTLRSQMGHIRQSEFVQVKAGVDNTLPAIEVETVFDRNGQAVWQKQLATQVPESDVLMIFTLSAMRPFNEEDGQRWNAFKQSLSLNKQRNA